MIITVDDTNSKTNFKVFIDDVDKTSDCVYIDTELGLIRVFGRDTDGILMVGNKNNAILETLYGKIEIHMIIKDLDQIESIIMLNRLIG